MLKIGELDRRIRIESPTSTTDNYGARTFTWSTVSTVWAKVLFKKSDNKEESQEMTNILSAFFYIRNLGITLAATYRILYDGKYYYINGYKEIDGREQFIEIEGIEKDNEQTV